MRRIDVIGIGIGVFALGGALYVALQLLGLDTLDAGIWSQVIFITVVLGWLATYLLRVFNKKMTFDQQVQDYEDAVLQKRLDEMTPEELDKLQAEIEQERQNAQAD